MNEIELLVKNTDKPLLLIFTILNNKIVTDENKLMVSKIFFQYHILIGIEYNLLLIENLKNNPKTISFIEEVYMIISKQLQLLPNIIKFYKSYNNSIWNNDIDKLIINIKNLQQNFLSLFDGSKGALYLHLKLKGMKEGNSYHYEQLLERLKKTFNMFKMKFFNEYKLVVLSYYQFVDLTFENIIKYTEYIFTKINNILNNIINYLILYDNYRVQLYNLLYTNSDLNINIHNVDSDLDNEDITLIVKN
jgi:hypothetical protein